MAWCIWILRYLCRVWAGQRWNNSELLSLPKLIIALALYDAVLRGKKTKSRWQQTRECGFPKLLCNCPPKPGDILSETDPRYNLCAGIANGGTWTVLASHAVLDSNTFCGLSLTSANEEKSWRIIYWHLVTPGAIWSTSFKFSLRLEYKQGPKWPRRKREKNLRDNQASRICRSLQEVIVQSMLPLLTYVAHIGVSKCKDWFKS